MSRLQQCSHCRNRVAFVSLCAILLGLGSFFLGRAPNQAAEDQKPPEKLEIKKGDHICIIGNTLADRMQHDGWLEAYFQSRFPKDELVFRNLGFSGDELTQRMRSQDFGTPDQWLSGSAPIPNPSKIADPRLVRKNRFELTKPIIRKPYVRIGQQQPIATR